MYAQLNVLLVNFKVEASCVRVASIYIEIFIVLSLVKFLHIHKPETSMSYYVNQYAIVSLQYGPGALGFDCRRVPSQLY